jgi:hypothetical protein
VKVNLFYWPNDANFFIGVIDPPPPSYAVTLQAHEIECFRHPADVLPHRDRHRRVTRPTVMQPSA